MTNHYITPLVQPALESPTVLVLHGLARSYVRSGLSVIPIRVDSTKAPSLSSWKQYQERKPDDAELQEWFANGKNLGIAVIAGEVSGGLEIIDIDEPDTGKRWSQLVKQIGATDLLAKLPVVQTPSGGWHIYYRCSAIDGNQKLALRQLPDKKLKVLLETRGEGGYVLAPGSPAECHSAGRPYALKRGSLEQIPEIAPDERDLLLSCARQLNEYIAPNDVVHGNSNCTNNNGTRPGDIFNQKANWDEILTPHGWTRTNHNSNYWRKPGDTGSGHHATTGLVGDDLFYCFSTAAYPFEGGKGYSKFSVYALLNNDGDFVAAAKELSSKGYRAPTATSIKNVSVIQDSEPQVSVWPVLKTEALYGLAGEFTNKVAGESEADAAAVLFTFLAMAGTAMGNESYAMVGNRKHPTRHNVLIVGATSLARKGTSVDPVKELANNLPDDLKFRITPGPLSSGEGLVYAVRDASEELNKEEKPIDPGVIDKRLLIIDEEFARALAACKKEGSTLLTMIRAIYDSGDLDPLTKHNRIHATGAHISIVTHITEEELRRRLDEVEIFAGTMNRFTLVCARRTKLVPRPRPLDAEWLEVFSSKFAVAIREARTKRVIGFSKEAGEIWDALYPDLEADKYQGILGAVTCRTAAKVLRYALTYARLDKKTGIEPEHLGAAIAASDYSTDSAFYLFGHQQAAEGDGVGRRILQELWNAPEHRLSQTEISDRLKRNFSSDRLATSLRQLQASGKITQEREPRSSKPGRPAIFWKLTKSFPHSAYEINELDEESHQ